jgi:hypothetical protein
LVSIRKIKKINVLKTRLNIELVRPPIQNSIGSITVEPNDEKKNKYIKQKKKKEVESTPVQPE